MKGFTQRLCQALWLVKDCSRFTFTKHELIDCAGSTRQLQSYLLDAPHGTGTGTVEGTHVVRTSARTTRHFGRKKGQKSKDACSIA